MKVYINENFEIKAIGYSEDSSLTEVTVDDGSLLSNLSNFMLFNYCCKPIQNGYELYPNIDYNTLKLMEEQEKKISSLKEENTKLKKDKLDQDISLESTQNAVDFILLGETSARLKDLINLGSTNISNYIAMRIIQKSNISEKDGQDYYVAFLTHQNYSAFKDEVDTILNESGNGNLIVELPVL